MSEDEKLGRIFLCVVANLSPKEISGLIKLLDKVKS